MRKTLFISVLVAATMIACNNSTNQTVTSSDATVATFGFVSDTCNPGLTSATYKVEQRTDTGLIYNQDSLAFGTRLDSVIPRVTYNATPASATFIFPDTTVISTGSDTMNFAQDPIYLHVKSSDLQHEKWYRIALTVHQVDPDLYVWTLLNPQVFDSQEADSKAFMWGDEIALLVNNGFRTQMFLSADGAVWRQGADPVGLPAQCRVRDILQYHDTLYYADRDMLYSSGDLIHWDASSYATADYDLVNMLVVFDDKAWGVLQDKTTQQLMLGYMQGGVLLPSEAIDGLQGNILPESFPVNDFAALSFAASSERPRAMVIGGRAIDGTAVNTRWNLERCVPQGYRVRDFSIEQPSFRSLTGMSVVQYDGHLVMFGGIDNDLEWRSDMLFSDDEGMNWYVPDTAHNRLPDTYRTRQKQSVVTDKQQNIYLIGGQSTTEVFSDVYRGHLNSINW